MQWLQLRSVCITRINDHFCRSAKKDELAANRFRLSTVYLIPSFLQEDTPQVLPAEVLTAVKDCQVFFVENERSARRFLKQLWKEMVIDDYEWHLADKSSIETPGLQQAFRHSVQSHRNIGIISEAGVPGVADPGQPLISLAHKLGARVKPLVGPSSILLALMASGMNGQQFRFIGYLPIDTSQRIKAIKEMEMESQRRNCTQVFMETPYRNNQLLETLLKTCQPATRLCIASEITGASEFIHTKTIEAWKKSPPDLHKKPVMFVLHG